MTHLSLDKLQLVPKMLRNTHPNMPDSAEQLIAELEALETVQERIDHVAEDFSSGQNRYSVLDAWQLSELLGLDFHDTADWGRIFYAYRREIDVDDFEHPWAENVGLLEGKIPQVRYQQLEGLAEEIIEKTDDCDLPLTDEEKALLKDAYAESQAEGSDLQYAATTLTSSNGIELAFEVCIGDGGDPFDEQSPYNLRDGKGFNSDEYIEVE